MKKRSRVAAAIILSIPAILLALIIELRNFSLLNQAKPWLGIVFLSLIIMLFSFTLVAQLSSRLNKFALIRFVRRYCLVYFGLILTVIAVCKDILPINMFWLDTNLLALGVTVIALGIAIIALEQASLSKKRGEQEATEILEQKLRKAEKVIDAFLEESKKLGKKLTALQKEKTSKR
jgi:undecaprenyl pyrophosphate phosphatase UppP